MKKPTATNSKIPRYFRQLPLKFPDILVADGSGEGGVTGGGVKIGLGGFTAISLPIFTKGLSDFNEARLCGRGVSPLA
ncbi:hypothetical protein H6789_02155 [Candidatus Nomurabacteria bacterium]|nr:hypothetical protein [Candidatus Nomurabacteria bacterium]